MGIIPSTNHRKQAGPKYWGSYRWRYKRGCQQTKGCYYLNEVVLPPKRKRKKERSGKLFLSPNNTGICEQVTTYYDTYLKKDDRCNLGCLNLFKSVVMSVTDEADGKRPKGVSLILTEARG